MKVTVIGSGNMGAGFVSQFTRAGHLVRVTARDLSKAQALASAHPGAIAVSPSEALGDSDVVVLAVGYGDAVAALQSLGDLTGRVVVDITNPLTADYIGLTIGHDTSASEEIAKAVPGAEVVKAFNTVFAQVLADGPLFADGATVPVYFAGDSERAKQTARVLIESIGFVPVDAGGLKNARYLEPLGGLNIYFGYGAGQGTQIAPTWIHRA
ncbi:NADPH-dependent F420 reductase [Corticimicrobacter populi]|uniref:NADPH-dependent F420 reductase n=1 Tax=Corticimicrobacter populi TaxID=2175229 RepID=A0A2V1JW90_9BURK|nr:NADPH-dependent F420 reductase [Corticimicrobacter populi]PWF22512.1 NADPH-dependent F420 reductase [Corticimicrobacter populi]